MKLVICTIAFLAACTPTEAKQGVKTVLDISSAVCQQLDLQDEPDWVKFSCMAAEGGKAATPFLAKVRKENATVLMIRHCK